MYVVIVKCNYLNVYYYNKYLIITKGIQQVNVRSYRIFLLRQPVCREKGFRFPAVKSTKR